MKKIAAILFLIFATVQVAPAVNSLFSSASTVFMVDEEKDDDVKRTDKKEKKDCPGFLHPAAELTHQLTIAFHLAETIFPSPCLEKLTPPPNFC